MIFLNYTHHTKKIKQMSLGHQNFGYQYEICKNILLKFKFCKCDWVKKYIKPISSRVILCMGSESIFVTSAGGGPELSNWFKSWMEYQK